MKRRRFTEAELEPSRWVWLRLAGKTHALAPDAHAECVSVLAGISEEERAACPHAVLVMFVASELHRRGWLRYEVERTASGRRRLVLKLVPREERPPPRAKRVRRRRAPAAPPPAAEPGPRADP